MLREIFFIGTLNDKVITKIILFWIWWIFAHVKILLVIRHENTLFFFFYDINKKWIKIAIVCFKR